MVTKHHSNLLVPHSHMDFFAKADITSLCSPAVCLYLCSAQTGCFYSKCHFWGKIDKCYLGLTTRGLVSFNIN